MAYYQREIVYHISSIICTLIFLIGSTYYWFFIRDFDVYAMSLQRANIVVSNDIYIKSLTKSQDEVIPYKFSITNQSEEVKTVKISVIPDYQTKLSNNYIKYTVNNEKYVRSLGMDGVIYITNLEGLEEKDFSLKLWVSETAPEGLDYDARVVIH